MNLRPLRRIFDFIACRANPGTQLIGQRPLPAARLLALLNQLPDVGGHDRLGRLPSHSQAQDAIEMQRRRFLRRVRQIAFGEITARPRRAAD
jgi:hypothetical protein